MAKYIFVIGGVMSSVGKGIVSASLGKIFQSRGYGVSNIKCDMYVNIDAGTIRPAEHGEVFVGEDGIEADQDLGNYERFTNQNCLKDNYLTTGQVYQEVIRKERNLEYEGEDVEVVPDVPKEIIRRIQLCQKKNRAEVAIIELGGTVGEYQVLLFLEAARMMKVKNPKDVFFVLVSFVPTPIFLNEQKSKPTQYAIRTLNSAGIAPDFIICRASDPLQENVKETISNVCSLPLGRIISSPTVHSIYDVPVIFEKQGLGDELLKLMKLKFKKSRIKEWEIFSKKIQSIKKEIIIGIVGKYFNFKSCRDTYISVIESINHAAWHCSRKPKILWLDAEKYEKDPQKLQELDNVSGIIIPGGFGKRGTEGMMLAAQYAREKKIPFLGLCLGMQVLTVEFARNVCYLEKANSEELDAKTKHPVIHIMKEQKKFLAKNNYGATMRLGAYPCLLSKGSLSFKAYGQKKISERHRHRYELNNYYREILTKHGLILAGLSPDKRLVEIVELSEKKHPFFMGVQFHPEFKSRPLNPHPLFREFIKASVRK